MKKSLLLLIILSQFYSFAQTEITVNRRRNEDNSQRRTIPVNPFVIKEGNTVLAIINVLKDDPRTIEFSSEVTVSNGSPTPNESTFNFGDTILTPEQEEIALQVITEHRDKSEFTEVDQLNISAQDQITEALEQLGDVFDEDNISDLIVPDVCDIRDQFEAIYNNNEWSSFSVGEKRILIADWLIPTDTERREIFQGRLKREEIYRLFASKMNDLSGLERIRSIEGRASELEGDEFTKFFKRALSPGEINLENEVFISRSNTSSDDANSDEVSVPVFSNVRTSSNIFTVLDDNTLQVDKNTVIDVEYSCTVQANGNKNWQIKVLLNGSDIDIQGMKRDGRGRNTVTHTKVRVSVSQGDTLELKLLPLNNNNGAVTALSGKSLIRVEEVLN